MLFTSYDIYGLRLKKNVVVCIIFFLFPLLLTGATINKISVDTQNV